MRANTKTLLALALAVVSIAAEPAPPTSVVETMRLPEVPAGPRQVNITTGSAPGWVPSEAVEEQAYEAARTYFRAVDSGDLNGAYAMLTPGLQAMLPQAQFKSNQASFKADAGTVKLRQVIKLTWTHSPTGGLPEGSYAAIDLASRFKKVDRCCGYIILFQATPAQAFQIAREEKNFISNTAAAGIVKSQSLEALDSMWRALSQNCPNQH
jgi:hypothetical protein